MSVLRVAKESENAIIPTFDSNGHYTLYALEDSLLMGNVSFPIRTGIKMAIPNNYCAMIVSNGTIKCLGGLIDSDYRGELKVIAIGPTDRTIKRGESIAKMFVLEIESPELEVCDSSIATECEDNQAHTIEN